MIRKINENQASFLIIFAACRCLASGTKENVGLSGIGMVSEGKGQVWGKDDPMQLSDIIPTKSMYDKMRPPKVEGEFQISKAQ